MAAFVIDEGERKRGGFGSIWRWGEDGESAAARAGGIHCLRDSLLPSLSPSLSRARSIE